MEKAVADFHRLIVEQIPLIDVRAPAEFDSGSIPGAVNLPLLSDEQRHRVGTCYKQRGREAALKLGRRLVSGEVKRSRMEAWRSFLDRHPAAHLYCARGGLRSEIVQSWLQEEAAMTVPRLSGGYKAMRAFFLAHLEAQSISAIPVVLGGRTGTGKTQVLESCGNSIDLEALANHRGSSFGRFSTPQPGQADFENRLAAELIKHGQRNCSHLLVEDEGRHVGKRFIPRGLRQFLATGDIVLLEAPLQERVANIMAEYVVSAQADHERQWGDREQALQRWQEEMHDGIRRIAKRLGPAATQRVGALLDHACARQLKTSRRDAHAAWITLLLSDYYDPMYDYQIGKKLDKVVFAGNADEVRAYLAQECGA